MITIMIIMIMMIMIIGVLLQSDVRVVYLPALRRLHRQEDAARSGAIINNSYYQ